MVCMKLSTCSKSCFHMLSCIRFVSHSPHVQHHFSICYVPHGLQELSTCMLWIVSAYADPHMARINCPHALHVFSTLFEVSLLMLFSIFLRCMFPHVLHHVSIRFVPPHVKHRTFHVFSISSPHVFSTWFTWILHMVDTCSPHHWKHRISTYVFLHMVMMRPSMCLKSCVHMLCSIRWTSYCPHILYHVSTCCSPHA